MQQVFINIIANAETEMSLAHGKGTLWIASEQKPGAIQISFKDDGPGITSENMQKLFQPFFTTRALGKGTGLGLSVCHGIVTEHKGRIWAESQSGNGATFFVELPLINQPQPP
jgi:signal transduction histidine kinase